MEERREEFFRERVKNEYGCGGVEMFCILKEVFLIYCLDFRRVVECSIGVFGSKFFFKSVI